jgi:hypothetical protein
MHFEDLSLLNCSCVTRVRILTSKIIYSQTYAQKDQNSSTNQTPKSEIFFIEPALGIITQTACMGKRSNAAEPIRVPGPKPANHRDKKSQA